MHHTQVCNNVRRAWVYCENHQPITFRRCGNVDRLSATVDHYVETLNEQTNVFSTLALVARISKNRHLCLFLEIREQ